MRAFLYYAALFGGALWGARLAGRWLARGMLAAARRLSSASGGSGYTGAVRRRKPHPAAALAALAKQASSAPQFDADILFLSFLADRIDAARSRRDRRSAVADFAVHFRQTAAYLRRENVDGLAAEMKELTAADERGRAAEKERARKVHPSNGG